MAAYRRVYDSRHLQADCQEPVWAPKTLCSVIEYRLPFLLLLRLDLLGVTRTHAHWSHYLNTALGSLLCIFSYMFNIRKQNDTFSFVRVTFFCSTFPNPCLLLPDSAAAIFNRMLTLGASICKHPNRGGPTRNFQPWACFRSLTDPISNHWLQLTENAVEFVVKEQLNRRKALFLLFFFRKDGVAGECRKGEFVFHFCTNLCMHIQWRSKVSEGGICAELRWWAPFDFKPNFFKTLLHTT